MAAFFLAFFITGQTLDTATTWAALNRPGFYEGNRLLPAGPTGIVLTKAAVMTGVGIYAWKLGRHHPKARLVLFAVVGAAGLAAGIHNYQVMRGRR